MIRTARSLWEIFTSLVSAGMVIVWELFKILLRVPEGQRSELSIIGWWEIRRVVYNLVVGAAGVASLFLMLNAQFFPPADTRFRDFEQMLIPVVGIMANICYTGGWVMEIALRKIFHEKVSLFGPIAFGIGLAGSLVVVVLPAAFHIVVWIARIFGVDILGDPPSFSHLLNGPSTMSIYPLADLILTARS